MNSTSSQQQLLSFDIKVYLEGAYTGGSPVLASSVPGETYFPTTQPYSGSEFIGTPMYYVGAETISGSVPAGTIDWVLVEVRSDGRARTDSVGTVAALLMEDGSIRGVDGTSLPLAVVNVLSTHYVVVRHRNHMPVMSDGSVDFSSGTPIQYDFTTASTQAFGTNPMATLGSSFGLVSGDPNGQNGITASDLSFWNTQNGGPDGYWSGDFNLNGQVTASDRSIWVTNNGLSSPVPDN
ncbi:MAG: hypothetical protein HKN13_00210 [Rhodothermales bacterium]|nr:hypothetical protein [Rhodothermales bacterium]